ncbi:MAG TPA: NAD(P)-binding domain-containing protein, partial [Methylomirabilota bacterium]|nr:NAD(P)-binding domain-containing protein [Methylomirabilota bacterium]
MPAVVAYIGMGLLGSALAGNLIKAGFTVRGYDIAPERMREHETRGGVPARSPADAARGASVVMSCLMTADLVREALLGPDGAVDAAPSGVVVIDNSTIHPDASAALAARLATRGIPMLDAPVAGSSGQARRRE